MLWGERMFENTWRISASVFAADRPIQVTDSTHKVVVLLIVGEVAIMDPDEDGVASDTLVVKSNTKASLEQFALQCRAFEDC